MTAYTYEHPTYGFQQLDFPFGEAPRSVLWDDEFAHRVYDAQIQFTYGTEDFHGPTIGERFERQVADCAADGKGYEPVGQRWI